jgi:hypothetical protein
MIATITTARISALLLAGTGLLFSAHTTPAAAEEQTLRFKLVTQQTGGQPRCPRSAATKLLSVSTWRRDV